ncbi:MAG: WD40 repeat domain-containing protein [Cyanobacteria bacterium J06638_22]
MIQTYTALKLFLGAALGLSVSLPLAVPEVNLPARRSGALHPPAAQASSEEVKPQAATYLTQRYRYEGDERSLLQPIVTQAISPQAAGAIAETLFPDEPTPSTSSWQTTPIATIPSRSEQMGLSGSGQRLMTLEDNGTRLQIWDIQTGEPLMEMLAEEGTRFDAAVISTSGTQIAVIVQSLPNHALTLHLWDAETGECLWQKPLGLAQSQFHDDEPSFFDAWTQVMFRPSDDAILTQVSLSLDADERATDWQLRLHDNATGETRQALTSTPGVENQRFEFSPDGTLLAGLGYIPTDMNTLPRYVVDVWQLEGGDRRMTIEREDDASLPFSEIAFTPDGYLNVMSQSLYDIQLDTWDVGTGARIGRLTELPEIDRQDRYPSLSPDGVYYFARSDVAGTRLFNLQNGRVTAIGGYVTDVTFNATGSHLAIAGRETVEIFSKVAVVNPSKGLQREQIASISRCRLFPTRLLGGCLIG